MPPNSAVQAAMPVASLPSAAHVVSPNTSKDTKIAARHSKYAVRLATFGLAPKTKISEFKDITEEPPAICALLQSIIALDQQNHTNALEALNIPALNPQDYAIIQAAIAWCYLANSEIDLAIDHLENIPKALLPSEVDGFPLNNILTNLNDEQIRAKLISFIKKNIADYLSNHFYQSAADKGDFYALREISYRKLKRILDGSSLPSQEDMDDLLSPIRQAQQHHKTAALLLLAICEHQLGAHITRLIVNGDNHEKYKDDLLEYQTSLTRSAANANSFYCPPRPKYSVEEQKYDILRQGLYARSVSHLTEILSQADWQQQLSRTFANQNLEVILESDRYFPRSHCGCDLSALKALYENTLQRATLPQPERMCFTQ